MPIKSFRGLMATDSVDTISLHTNNGTTGYKIKKIQALSWYPTGSSPEVVLKIYSVPQEVVTEDIYITCYSTDNRVNYYIELEQVKLDLGEQTVATLRDIRNIVSQ